MFQASHNKEDPLILTKIKLSLEYKSERKTSTSSALIFYTLLLFTSSPLLSFPILIDPSSYYNMSQNSSIDQILLQIRQQQKQIVVLQVLLVVRGEVAEKGEVETIALKLNTKSNIKVAKLPIFNRNATKVLGFIIYKKNQQIFRRKI